MTTVALIQNGLVVGVQPSAHPTVPLAEQFNAALNPTDVTNVSPQPQVGWTATPASDGGWTFAPPPAPPPPTPAQQLAAAAAALMAGGVTVTSAATPALNGTYATGPTNITYISGLSAGIAAGKPLPGGGTTFNYRDADGANHAFTAANFLNFAAAVETFIYQIEQAESVSDLPSSAITIP